MKYLLAYNVQGFLYSQLIAWVAEYNRYMSELCPVVTSMYLAVV